MPRKRATKKRHREVVALLWLDAAGSDLDRDVTPIHAITYGEIVEMNDEYVTIASEVFTNGDSRHHTSVPRGMVVKVMRGKFPQPEEFEEP